MTAVNDEDRQEAMEVFGIVLDFQAGRLTRSEAASILRDRGYGQGFIEIVLSE